MTANSDFDIVFYRSDPLLRLLVGRLHFRWWHAAFTCVLLWMVDSVLLSHLTNTLFPQQGLFSFSEDFFAQLFGILLPSIVIIAYYVFSGTAFPSLIWELSDDGALNRLGSTPQVKGDPPHGYIWAVHRLESVWNHNGWCLLSLSVVFIWGATLLVPLMNEQDSYNYWWSLTPGIKNYFIFKGLLWTYLVARIIVQEFLALYSLNRLVNWNILRYQVFYPDKAAGLSSIGRYRLRIVYAMVFLGVWFFFSVFQQVTGYAHVATSTGPILTGIMLVLYLLLIPIVFFGALLSVHNFMVVKKREGIRGEMSRVDLHETSSLFAAIENGTGKNPPVRDIYGNAPEWPYNTSVMRRFLGAWGALVLSFVLSILSGLIVAWLSR